MSTRYEQKMHVGLLAITSVLPAGAVWLTFVAMRIEISPDQSGIRIYIALLALGMTSAMLRSMFAVLILPAKLFKTSAYVLFTTVCIGIPFSFAAIYSLFERTGKCIKGYGTEYDPIHFSFTTFTTLGYGDLSPLGACRIFTAVEALLGYLVLGIVVAILFKLYQERNSEEVRRYEIELEERVWSSIEKKFEFQQSQKDHSDR